MNTRRGFLVVLGLLVIVTACSSSTTPTAAPPPLTATVADAAGDTVIVPVLRNGVLLTPVVAVPPDLINASINVSGGNLTATIGFAPGTLSHTDTLACLMLDVDENASTGGPSA